MIKIVKDSLAHADAVIKNRPGDPIEEARHLHKLLGELKALYASDGLVKADRISIGVMMRRTERLIGQAIKRGQDAGMIAKRGSIGGFTKEGHMGSVSKNDRAGNPEGHYRGDHLVKVRDVIGVKNTSDVAVFYDMAEPIPEEIFEDVLNDGIRMGNVSRRTIVNRMRKITARDPDFKIKQIRNLAERGHSVDQIAKFTGLRRGYIRLIARRHDIDMPGDVTTRRYRRLDDQLIVTRTVMSLEGIAAALDVFDPDEVTNTEDADQWAESVATSIRAMIKFHKQLKEMAHGQQR